MPRQIITIEIDYNLFASDEPTDKELNMKPVDWPLEDAIDHYADCTEQWGCCWNNNVRVIQASSPTFAQRDEDEAEAHETTLDELKAEHPEVLR